MRTKTFNKLVELLVARILQLEECVEHYESLYSANRQSRETKNLRFGAGYEGLATNDDLPTQKKAPNKKPHSSDDVLILK